MKFLTPIKHHKTRWDRYNEVPLWHKAHCLDGNTLVHFEGVLLELRSNGARHEFGQRLTLSDQGQPTLQAWMNHRVGKNESICLSIQQVYQILGRKLEKHEGDVTSSLTTTRLGYVIRPLNCTEVQLMVLAGIHPFCEHSRDARPNVSFPGHWFVAIVPKSVRNHQMPVDKMDYGWMICNNPINHAITIVDYERAIAMVTFTFVECFGALVINNFASSGGNFCALRSTLIASTSNDTVPTSENNQSINQSIVWVDVVLTSVCIGNKWYDYYV